MEIDLILNELSIDNPSIDRQSARQLMSELITTIKAVKERKIKVSLRTKDNFYAAMLSPVYSIRQWLNDADEVERLFVKTLATKAPFSIDIDDLKIKELEMGAGLSEFRYEDKLAIGLGVAYLLDTIAISLRSSNCWDTSYLTVNFQHIDEIDGEVIESQEIVQIIHVSHSSHVCEHTDWIDRRVRTGIISGEVLWKNKQDLFPSLLFCESIREQVIDLEAENPLLKQIIKRLFELDEQTQKWTHGNFKIDLLTSKASPESESRLQEFKKRLTFQCPDSEERIVIVP